MRAFIAIEIPEEIKAGITAIQDQLKASGAEASWTRPEGIHLTLKFLGELPEARTSEIMSALGDVVAGSGGFSLDVAGTGAFPNVRNPRVLWVGVKGDIGKLASLQSLVESAMTRIGFDPEERRFSPHLTLARIKYLKPRFSWQQAIDDVKNSALGGFSVRCISLMKSELKPSGAVYTEMGRVELK